MGGAGSRWEGPREGLGRPPQIGSVGRGLALGKGNRATWAQVGANTGHGDGYLFGV